MWRGASRSSGWGKIVWVWFAVSRVRVGLRGLRGQVGGFARGGAGVGWRERWGTCVSGFVQSLKSVNEAADVWAWGVNGSSLVEVAVQSGVDW